MSKNIITVGELIEELKKYPPELKVFDFMLTPIDKTYYEEDIPLGDSANPNCEFVRGVIIE